MDRIIHVAAIVAAVVLGVAAQAQEQDLTATLMHDLADGFGAALVAIVLGALGVIAVGVGIGALVRWRDRRSVTA